MFFFVVVYCEIYNTLCLLAPDRTGRRARDQSGLDGADLRHRHGHACHDPPAPLPGNRNLFFFLLSHVVFILADEGQQDAL